MKSCFKRLCSLVLSLVLIVTIFVPGISPVEAASYEIYKDYTTPSSIKDYGSCGSMQGFTCDSTYGYSVKIKSDESLAIIYRTKLSDGTSTKMTDTLDGSYYFAGLGHANDLEVAKINGTDNLFVATGGTGDYDIIRYTISGTTLTKVGGYNVTVDGAGSSASSAQVMHKDANNITFLVKKNKTFYTFTMKTSATSGTFAMKEAFTINVADVVIEGVSKNLSSYLQQGFCYYDNKVFVPMTGNTAANLSAIVVYDIEGATGTIKSDPTLSFFFTSTAYSDLFEVESCGICPTDGKLYFATNRRKSSSDYNHDGVHYVDDYIYDPSYDDISNSGNFRWETSSDKLVSVTSDGNSFNSATLYSGSLSGGTFADAQYNLDKTVKLYHNVPWIIEWRSKGAWTTGTLLFSGAKDGSFAGNRYLYRRKNSTLIALGEYKNGAYQNYGLELSTYGIDGTAEHVISLQNRIASDGSNMVYLFVDGKELGPMNNYYVNGASQGSKSNWISGKDFTFSYMGTIAHPVTDCSMEYIQVWSNGIPEEDMDSFRWETRSNTMTGVSASGTTLNATTWIAGSCTNGVYASSQYSLAQEVTLLHDRNWTVEWQSEGTWTGGALLFAAAKQSRVDSAPYILRSSNSGVIAMGIYQSGKFHNYGLMLSDYGIDGTALHTYRMENQINADGSNMVYLYVDGVKLGALNNYYVGGTAQGTTSNWISGKDFTFSYMGTGQHPINSCSIGYIQVNEGCTHNWTDATCTTAKTCTVCGETEGEALGHNYVGTVKPGTCTIGGYTKYTCTTCGRNYISSGPDAPGHTWVDATCTAPKTCSVCGETEGEKLSHNYESTVKAPTCTKSGYTTYTCTGCGDNYIGDVVGATGHAWSAGICGGCGTICEHSYQNGICTVCGNQETVVQNSPDIKWQVTNGTNASSTSTNLRLLTWVDSPANYSSVTFNVTINGRTTQLKSTTAYTAILAAGVAIRNPANIFKNSDANYFVTYTLKNVPSSYFDIPIVVTVTWTDLAGKEHTSESKTIVIASDWA